MLRLKAGVNRENLPETGEEQSRADEQDECESDFGDDEASPQAPRTNAGGDRALLAVEPRGRRRGHRGEAGQHTKKDTDDRADANGERDGARIELYLGSPRQILKIQGVERPQSHPSDDETGRTGPHGEDEAFRDQLSRNPGSSCAKRQPRGHLLHPHP